MASEDIMGRIHSIETCGTVDGPGVRFVVFLQGCTMRCKYCHNPDTWDLHNGKEMSVTEIISKYDSVKEFCKGGITATGGEPLLQAEFVTELFARASEKEIHTALDTSGVLYNPADKKMYEELLKYTDLVLLDIKHINDEEHKKLTGYSNKSILAFAKYLSEINKPVWIRHVVVPGITYNESFLSQLGEFLGTLNNVKALDVLPYHDMAIPKYESLGLKYPLPGVLPLKKEEALKARNIIIKSLQNTRKIFN